MGQLLAAYFTPNGSYLMQDHEDGNRTPQIESLEEVREQIEQGDPDAIVAVSPHWQPRRAFYVEDSVRHFNVNDYPLLPQPFGRRYFRYVVDGDPHLATQIVSEAIRRGLPAEAKEYGIDHGAFTALRVLENTRPVVPVATGLRPHEECRTWGAAIRAAIERSGKRVIALCPGNLSHRLDLRQDTEENEYEPRLADFDQAALGLLTSGEYQDPLSALDPTLCQFAAPETGLRTFSVLHGITGGSPGEVMSYKPYKYSIGDVVVRFKPSPTMASERAQVPVT